MTRELQPRYKYTVLLQYPNCTQTFIAYTEARNIDDAISSAYDQMERACSDNGISKDAVLLLVCYGHIDDISP